MRNELDDFNFDLILTKVYGESIVTSDSASASKSTGTSTFTTTTQVSTQAAKSLPALSEIELLQLDDLSAWLDDERSEGVVHTSDINCPCFGCVENEARDTDDEEEDDSSDDDIDEVAMDTTSLWRGNKSAGTTRINFESAATSLCGECLQDSSAASSSDDEIIIMEESAKSRRKKVSQIVTPPPSRLTYHEAQPRQHAAKIAKSGKAKGATDLKDFIYSATIMDLRLLYCNPEKCQHGGICVQSVPSGALVDLRLKHWGNYLDVPFTATKRAQLTEDILREAFVKHNKSFVFKVGQTPVCEKAFLSLIGILYSCWCVVVHVFICAYDRSHISFNHKTARSVAKNEGICREW
jgi:hypothetical protein